MLLSFAGLEVVNAVLGNWSMSRFERGYDSC